MQTEPTGSALLDDDHELDPDCPSTTVHLARCAECAEAVKFRPSGTGQSFILVDADPEARFGVGEHGRPVCPNGHGEMAIADDALKPAAEAFTDARAALLAAESPVQRTLPGVVPAFNFQGCYMELEQQAVVVEALQKEYEDDARVAKDSKKAWDQAEEKFTKMALEFRRRRQARDDDAIDPTETGARSPRLVKCTWEAQHAGETCPLCSDQTPDFVVMEMFGRERTMLPAADAEAHVETVDLLIVKIEIDETIGALMSQHTYIADEVLATWTSDDRKAVILYADQQLAIAHETIEPGVERLPRPAILGKPHIPEPAQRDPERPDDAWLPQACSVCGAVLPREADDDAYQVTDLVGVDCTGKVKKAKGPDHHYTETGKKKPAAAKKTGKGRR